MLIYSFLISSCLSLGSDASVHILTSETNSSGLAKCDTTIQVGPDLILPPLKTKPSLKALKQQLSNSNNDPKYVAIGGKLSSGFRDGGLYRVGQLTAYPNLIAHQMGLVNFNSPLFNLENGNGSGYSVLHMDGTKATWKKVVNNTAVISEMPLKFNKYSGDQVQNLSFPYGPMFISSLPENAYVNFPKRREYIAYYNRILNQKEEGVQNLEEILMDLNPDICTYETHFDVLLGLAENPVNLQTDFLFTNLDEAVTNQYLMNMIKKGTKLVLYSIPQVMDLPYFHIYPVKGIIEDGKTVFVRYKNNHINPLVANEQTLFLPNDSVQKLFAGQSNQGLSAENPLNDQDVISEDEIAELKRGVTMFNKFYVWRAAEKHNLPVVDLENIYRKIVNGSYVSDDGVKVSGSFPEGNFFSSDGRTPSALGQAILANETIKVINSHYKTNIPLINISEFKKLFVR